MPYVQLFVTNMQFLLSQHSARALYKPAISALFYHSVQPMAPGPALQHFTMLSAICYLSLSLPSWI